MKAYRITLAFVMLWGVALLSGCAANTTYLEMSRTAGYVGSRTGKMYVVNIGGKDAKSFREELYTALSRDGHFTTEGYGIAPPEKPDSTMTMPSIILSGVHSTHEDTRYFTEGSGDEKKKYKQITESHEFQYSIRDAVTGEELETNVLNHENVSKEEDKDAPFLDAVVGGMVKGALEDLFGVESAHRKELIKSFIASLRLHPVRRSIGLLDDKEIPELKEGVEVGRTGDWAAAIAKFQAGAEGHPGSQALHKAYFDLGVAYEFRHEFDKALTSFGLADELAPQAGYADEISYCQWYARQYRWQQRYGGSATGIQR